MEKILGHILKQSMAFVPKFGIAILIFLLSWVLGNIVQKMLFRISRRSEEGKNHVLRLAGSSSKIAILLVGGVTALGTLGINVTALVASLGLSGFALGFALKDALSNLLAGALILIYKPFRCGEYIAVAGCEGEVIEINLRYTTLQGEGKKYLIPNGTLFTNLIGVLNKGQ